MNLRAERLTASRGLKLEAGEKALPIGYLLVTYRLRLMFFSISMWLSVGLSWRDFHHLIVHFIALSRHLPVMDFSSSFFHVFSLTSLSYFLFHFLLDLLFLLPLFCHPMAPLTHIFIISNLINCNWERDRVNRQSQNSRPYTWSEVLIRKYMYRRRHIRTHNKHK